MSVERVSFEAKLLAPPAHETQSVRDDPEDAYERSVREAVRREAPAGREAKWDGEAWPFPLASFWTTLLVVALCSLARLPLLTLGAAAFGSWLGVMLDRWLRRHPSTGGRRLRWILGVG